MAIFRVEKTRDYTIMANHHLRNKGLSLKAKGLLSLMLSLPDNWDYSINGLVAICKESRDGVNATIQELEKNKYVIRNNYRNENGHFETEYIIYETPQTKKQEKELKQKIKEEKKKPIPKKGIGKNVEKSTKSPIRKNRIGKTDIETPIRKNRNGKADTETPIRNNRYGVADTVNPIQLSTNNKILKLNTKNKRLDKIKALAIIKTNVNYDELKRSYKNSSIKKIDELLEIASEMVSTNQEYIQLSRNKVKISEVRNKIFNLKYEHIEYILESLKNSKKDVKNIKAYLMSVLYNATTTIENYYDNKVNALQDKDIDPYKIIEIENKANNARYERSQKRAKYEKEAMYA